VNDTVPDAGESVELTVVIQELLVNFPIRVVGEHDMAVTVVKFVHLG
jgi:hypothetical protein